MGAVPSENYSRTGEVIYNTTNIVNKTGDIDTGLIRLEDGLLVEVKISEEEAKTRIKSDSFSSRKAPRVGTTFSVGVYFPERTKAKSVILPEVDSHHLLKPLYFGD